MSTEAPSKQDPSADAPAGPPVLEMRGIGKEFLRVRVLEGIDLDCRAGEVHAIVGENGAGKTTLMKILVGAYAPGEGEVRIGGNPVHFNHPLEAQHAGVAIIYQEFNLLPDRSVAENIKVKRGLRRLRGKLRVTLLVEMSGAEREVSDSLKLTLVGRKKRR